MMKHSATDHGTANASKRRAPYAAKACEACRRRKGRCDGQQPCDFCAGRDQDCVYEGTVSDDWSSQYLFSHRSDKETPLTRPGRCNYDHIANLVLEVKTQLDSLSRRVESQTSTFATTTGGNNNGSYPGSTRYFIREDRHQSLFEETSIVSTQCFYGPTSPDYSLNIAQIRVRQTDHPSDITSHRQLQLASIDTEPAPLDNTTDGSEDTDSPISGLGDNCDGTRHLMGFRALINYKEALKLLALYQDIVGEFHPFVNVDKLVTCTRAWYIESPRPLHPGIQGYCSDSAARPRLVDELLIYNLVLAIALHADPQYRNSGIEATIWRNCKAAVNNRLIGQAKGIDHVTVVLLKAWYDFTNDAPRSAWRTCGIAGRMLMELGFHNYEVLSRMMPAEKQRAEASNLLCSITVLDRQWSATTGLPANFDAKSFDTSFKTNIENPYLQAMMLFIQISDKFHEPISQAARGETYPDDDSFEVLNFQIEQWRKKAVGSYSFSDISSWKLDPTKRPPSWAIILHLRAECICSLLLRPFFFSHANTASGQKYFQPAVDLLIRVTDILFHLDTTTDLYQKHHPYYQHVLASCTALSFLLAATLVQNKNTMLDNLTPDLSRKYSSNFEMSLALASKYASNSRLSGKLHKRLSDMRGILEQLGLVNSLTVSMESSITPTINCGSLSPNLSRPLQDSNLSGHILQTTVSRLGSPLPDGGNMTSLEESSMLQEWSNSLLEDWSFDTSCNMFLSS